MLSDCWFSWKRQSCCYAGIAAISNAVHLITRSAVIRQFKNNLGLPTYYGNGYGGQTLYVVPDLDLVVATAVTGTDVDEPDNQQPVLPIVEETIIPAAMEG